MNDDWQTYRLGDFLPVTPEVYWRLIERVNEAWWPLQLLTLALGLAALVMALRGNRRIAWLLLAPAWLSSGVIFHLNYYAELNWAASWFGRGFIAQAGVLLALVAFAGPGKVQYQPGTASTAIGAILAISALLAYPLIALTLGGGATHAEIFGLHPDPTAIATLGILLAAHRGPATWLALPIPLLASLLATLTLVALEADWAYLPAAAAGVALLTLFIRTVFAPVRGK